MAVSLQGLLTLLQELPPIQEALSLLGERGACGLSAGDPLYAPLLALPVRALGRPLLALAPTPEEARRLAEELSIWLGEDTPVLPFPEEGTLPFERVEVDEATVHARLRALSALALWGRGYKGPPPVVVAPAQCALDRLPLPERLAGACHTLAPGQRVRLGPLLEEWVALGYRHQETVETPGSFSRRGGILDIWPPGEPLPVRLELWGDVVDSLRAFDPETQRSTGPLGGVTITPAREVLPRLAGPPALQALEGVARGWEGTRALAGLLNTACLLDYLGREGLLALVEPSRLAHLVEDCSRQVEGMRRSRVERGLLPADFPSPLWRWEEVAPRYLGYAPSIHLGPLQGGAGTLPLQWSSPPSFWGRVEGFARAVADLLHGGARVVVASHHAPRLKELLAGEGVPSVLTERVDAPPPGGQALLVPEGLSAGFTLDLPSGPLALFTDAEALGTAKRRRPLRRGVGRRPRLSLAELTPGSYVVHVDHGVARFAGVRRVSTAQGEREYLVLEYAEGDRLYVPTDQLDRVSPYISPSDRPPTLTRLGTQEWARARERARRSAWEMARELLELYAARQLAQGHAFSPDTPWQRQLEDSFPYLETPDQAEAVAEIKRDMESPRPMDRLLCGDVGFGKTEVALRAAFKAVMDGKQVAVLVPTTVLAQQHYATFCERLAPFPVRVEVLSRFRTSQEQKEVLRRLREGEVDIVIGTHRLLQRDVAFKDLGLVVIDDEHRFGVAHKERLKQLRHEVDVLTMTATPIPRTLYMALSGIRDMSLIETPPAGRAPVKTCVAERSEEVIREAVLRELERGGQVYFLHNRVRSIDLVARELERIVPQARVAVAHGRMPEEELARVMADFTARRYDVLVCTTIIEAGLDIPTANTIVIDRAHKLGLSQLYQLRGRVGRSDQRGYCYLLVPRGARLTEAAHQRLKALLAASHLGAGFQVALRDMEIRGAGNLLGPEQSGHMHAVGFDLYVRMLQEAVEELKARREGNPPPPPAPRVTVDLPLEAYIPEDYIPDLPTRLEVYRRLAGMTGPEEPSALAEELRDRFGPLPQEVENLLLAVRLKALAGKAGVEAVARQGGYIVLRAREPIGGARDALQSFLGAVARVGHQQVRVPMEGRWPEAVEWALQRIARFRERALRLADRVAASQG